MRQLRGCAAGVSLWLIACGSNLPDAALPESPPPPSPASAPAKPASPPETPAVEVPASETPAPARSGGWTAGQVFTPARDWPGTERGSAQPERDFLAVKDGRVLVTTDINQLVTMDEAAHYLRTWLVEGDQWRALGPWTRGYIGWSTSSAVAWGADGAPLRLNNTVGLRVERWDGQAWRDAVVVPLPEGRRAECVSLLNGKAGTLLTWRESNTSVENGTEEPKLRAARIDVATSRFEFLGESIRARAGQSFYWCGEAQLDASGQPVLVWEERSFNTAGTERDAVRVARWDEGARRWHELPPADDGGRELFYPHLALGPDGEPVVAWWAWSTRGATLETRWELRRYDTASGRWDDLPPFPESFVTNLHVPPDGHLVACKGLACYRVADGRWRSMEGTDTQGAASLNALTSDATGTLFLLGRDWNWGTGEYRYRLYRATP